MRWEIPELHGGPDTLAMKYTEHGCGSTSWMVYTLPNKGNMIFSTMKSLVRLIWVKMIKTLPGGQKGPEHIQIIQ